jgi:WD40 repeat protein
VIIAGTYSGPASFGGTQPLSGHDNFPAGDVFVARYAAGNGAFVWANGYGSNGADHAYKVRVAGGAAFVAGSFSPATPGAGILLGGDLLSSAGGTDGFVAKYDVATGSHIWSKPIGGPSEDRVLDLTMADQIWVTLSFSGATKIGNTNYTSSGISDVAFGSLSLSTGATGTSGAFGGPDVDDGTAIAVNSTALCIAGWFVGSTTLIYGNPLPGTGMTDAFIGCATP